MLSEDSDCKLSFNGGIMKKLLVVSALFVVAACLPLQATAVISLPPLPTVSISVGGVPVVDPIGPTISYDPERNQGTILWNLSTTDWSFSVDATTTPDPF